MNQFEEREYQCGGKHKRRNSQNLAFLCWPACVVQLPLPTGARRQVERRSAALSGTDSTLGAHILPAFMDQSTALTLAPGLDLHGARGFAMSC